MSDGALTQEEIDILLDAISGERKTKSLSTLDDLDQCLTDENTRQDFTSYEFGIFARNPDTIKLSIHENSTEENVRLLGEIKQLNRKQGIEPWRVGNLELVQYARCPECHKVERDHDI